MARKGLTTKFFKRDGIVEIEHSDHKKVSLEVSSNITLPTGALYKIQIYESEKDKKRMFQEDVAYVMRNGEIVKRQDYAHWFSKSKK